MCCTAAGRAESSELGGVDGDGTSFAFLPSRKINRCRVTEGAVGSVDPLGVTAPTPRHRRRGMPVCLVLRRCWGGGPFRAAANFLELDA